MRVSMMEFRALSQRVQRIEALVEAIAVRLEIPVEEVLGRERIEVPAVVAQLVAEGKKIAAIKMLREQQGLDLATAKHIVDNI